MNIYCVRYTDPQSGVMMHWSTSIRLAREIKKDCLAIDGVSYARIIEHKVQRDKRDIVRWLNSHFTHDNNGE